MHRYAILFVCMGNICRSPAGEGVLRHKWRQAGLEDQVLVDSAGTIGYHAGEPPDRRMREAAKARGIVVEGAARQVRRDDLKRFDLILAMDEENYAALCALDAEGLSRRKIERFCAWCQTQAAREVPDPYYGGPQGFEVVLDLLEDGCTQLLQHLRKTLQSPDPSPP